MDKYKILTHFVVNEIERIQYFPLHITEYLFEQQIVILQKDDTYYKIVYFGDDVIGNAKNIYKHHGNYFSITLNSSQYLFYSLIELEDITDYLDKIL
jgi:hypothetical protein